MTRGYRGLQGGGTRVKGGYKGFEGVTRGYKGLQGMTRGYRGSQRVMGVTRAYSG